MVLVRRDGVGRVTASECRVPRRPDSDELDGVGVQVFDKFVK